MACTIAVARRGQQRSLVRTFQALWVALARSPRARIRACERLTAFCRRDSSNELHRVIQILFDWDDDHLHVFTVDRRRYANPFFGLQEAADEFRARIGRLAPSGGATLTYVYDLGDHWEHRIVVERIMETDDPADSVVCVGGQGDAPAGRATRRRRTGFPAATETRRRSISPRSTNNCTGATRR